MISAQIEGLDQLPTATQSIPEKIQAGVKLDASVVTRGMVWEYGRIDIQPGPKTMLSTNMDGEERVLTITAPHGWIRVNRDKYQQIIKQRIAQIQWNKYPLSQWEKVLRDTAYKAMQECAEVMEQTAPVDSGELRGGIIPVNEPDPILEG